jgi:hypothetical protein
MKIIYDTTNYKFIKNESPKLYYLYLKYKHFIDRFDNLLKFDRNLYVAQIIENSLISSSYNQLKQMSDKEIVFICDIISKNIKNNIFLYSNKDILSELIIFSNKRNTFYKHFSAADLRYTYINNQYLNLPNIFNYPLFDNNLLNIHHFIFSDVYNQFEIIGGGHIYNDWKFNDFSLKINSLSEIL